MSTIARCGSGAKAPTFTVNQSEQPQGARPAHFYGAIRLACLRGHLREVADHPRRPLSHASPTLGLSSRARAACALQLSKTASLVVLRLLNAADHRVRPHTAAGGSEGSQEKSREPRSPTSRCTARLRLLQMAVVGRFKQELAAIPHDQLAAAGPGSRGNYGLELTILSLDLGPAL